jgi:O-antigen ligase
MRALRGAPTQPSNWMVPMLASIPLLDCILNQLNNAFQISFGGLSLLQVLRGYMVVIFLAVSVWSLVKDRAAVARIPLPAVCALLLIGVFITKELVMTGTLAMASLGAYGQMTYWVSFWITVSILCHEPAQSEIILRGLAVGALATAVSVMLGFLFGGVNYYQDDSVASSAGWFNTAKNITGVLVTGGVVLLYLGRRRARWLYPLLASFCFLACVLTYARAGSISLAAVLLWLVLWTVLFARQGKQRWIARFLILTVISGALLPAVVGPGTLFARWNDFQDADKAGSGRATFWKVALNGYWDGTADQQALGYGYSAMSDMLFLNYGADIKHTHNDMLDMMLVGGIPGACWLLFLLSTLLGRVGRTALSSVEGAAGFAIFLTFLLHGQFTGQLWGTDAMTYYMLSLTSLYVIGRSRVSPQETPFAVALHEFAASTAHA